MSRFDGKRFIFSILLITTALSGCGNSTEQQEPEKVSTDTEIASEEVLQSTSGEQTLQSNSNELLYAWDSDFTVSDSYGRIYPYISGIRYKSVWGETVRCGYYYGLIDEKGNVIEDALYTQVQPALWKEQEDEENTETEIYPYWFLGRYEGVTDEVLQEETEECYDGEDNDEDDDEYDEEDAHTSWCLAAIDGSFASPCKYHYVYTTEYGVCLNNLLTDSDEESTEDDDILYLLDREGNLFLTGDEIISNGVSADAISENREFYLEDYGEGLFVVVTVQGTYFMNREGQFVLGPYEEARAFHQGRAVVYDMDGQNGIIDTDGQWIVEPGLYNMLQTYHYGYTTGQLISSGREDGTAEENGTTEENDSAETDAFEEEDEDTGVLLDLDGNVVASKENGYYSHGPDGYDEISFADYSYIEYSYDGEEIRRGTEMDWESDPTQQFMETNLWYTTLDSGIEIENRSTGTKLCLTDGEYYADMIYDESSWNNEWDYEFSDYFLIHKYDPETEESKTNLYDTATLQPIYQDAERITRISDPFSDAYLIKVYMDEDSDTYVLLDRNGKEICTTDVYLEICNNNYMVADEKGCSYYDSEGNEWFHADWK